MPSEDCPSEQTRPEYAPPERRQLLLPFVHAAGYDARDFVPAASNEQALTWLGAAWPDDRLALWGPPGCGKSHLLHMWAERVGARVLAGQTLGGLDALPDSGGLALDDADSVAAEPLLLHLLNTARDRALKVLLAGRLPTSRWPVRLPDLSSRLRAIAAVEIGAPDDDLLAALLIRLLADRQLRVTRAVQTRLLTRLPRSAEAMRHAVARLDRASLTLGKPVGIALADQIISELSGTRDATLDGYEHSKSAATPSSQTPGFL